MPELRRRLDPRVERLGYLGEFFQVGAHQPWALAHFIDFTEALKEALEPGLIEAVALTVAAATGNDYERVQHEQLALSLGFGEDWVRGLLAAEPDASGPHSVAELAAAALARAVVAARGTACSERYQELEALVGPAAAVGCLMVAVRYLAHATMANTWGLRPPVESPLSG